MIKKALLLSLLITLMPLSRCAAAARPPQRLISLTPGITEMLFSLGLGKEIVGESLYSDFPPAAQSIPKIGGVQADAEKIVALRPTLVIGDAVATPEADAQLAHLHLHVLAIRPVSLPAIEQSLLQIGQATGTLGQARAEAVHMQAVQHQVQTLVNRSRFRPRVLIVIGTHPLYVAGKGTFMDSILQEAGGMNAADVTGYSVLSREQVLAHPPDIILADRQDQAALQADPVLRLVPAVSHNDFVFIPDNLLQRPGPRIVQGLQALALALHPGAK